MAFCRYSSNNWMCDIYMYSCETGYVIRVASLRLKHEPPVIDAKDDIKLLELQIKKQNKFLETAEMSRIGLKYDGKVFYDLSCNEALDTLKMLHDEGYRFDYERIVKGITDENLIN